MYRRILLSARKQRLQKRIDRFLDHSHTNLDLITDNVYSHKKKTDKKLYDYEKVKTKKKNFKKLFFLTF